MPPHVTYKRITLSEQNDWFDYLAKNSADICQLMTLPIVHWVSAASPRDDRESSFQKAVAYLKGHTGLVRTIVDGEARLGYPEGCKENHDLAKIVRADVDTYMQNLYSTQAYQDFCKGVLRVVNAFREQRVVA